MEEKGYIKVTFAEDEEGRFAASFEAHNVGVPQAMFSFFAGVFNRLMEGISEMNVDEGGQAVCEAFAEVLSNIIANRAINNAIADADDSMIYEAKRLEKQLDAIMGAAIEMKRSIVDDAKRKMIENESGDNFTGDVPDVFRDALKNLNID